MTLFPRPGGSQNLRTHPKSYIDIIADVGAPTEILININHTYDIIK